MQGRMGRIERPFVAALRTKFRETRLAEVSGAQNLDHLSFCTPS